MSKSSMFSKLSKSSFSNSLKTSLMSSSIVVSSNMFSAKSGMILEDSSGASPKEA